MAQRSSCPALTLGKKTRRLGLADRSGGNVHDSYAPGYTHTARVGGPRVAALSCGRCCILCVLKRCFHIRANVPGGVTHISYSCVCTNVECMRRAWAALAVLSPCVRTTRASVSSPPLSQCRHATTQNPCRPLRAGASREIYAPLGLQVWRSCCQRSVARQGRRFSEALCGHLDL